MRKTWPRERKQLTQLGRWQSWDVNSALTHWPYHTEGQAPRQERTEARLEVPHRFSAPPYVLLKGLRCPHQAWLNIGPKAQEVPPIQKDDQVPAVFSSDLTGDWKHRLASNPVSHGPQEDCQLMANPLPSGLSS